MKFVGGLVLMKVSTGALSSTPSHLSKAVSSLFCLGSVKSYSYLRAYIVDSFKLIPLYVTHRGG